MGKKSSRNYNCPSHPGHTHTHYYRLSCKDPLPVTDATELFQPFSCSPSVQTSTLHFSGKFVVDLSSITINHALPNTPVLHNLRPLSHAGPRCSPFLFSSHSVPISRLQVRHSKHSPSQWMSTESTAPWPTTRSCHEGTVEPSPCPYTDSRAGA